VRLGSGLATAAGTRRLRIELPREATVDTLLARVGELEPAIAPALGSALPVVKGTHASRTQALTDGDEIALLIPVAGGAGPSTVAGRAGPNTVAGRAGPNTERRQSWP
jgi:molybdopterin synthase sulfur carrier subunit